MVNVCGNHSVLVLENIFDLLVNHFVNLKLRFKYSPGIINNGFYYTFLWYTRIIQLDIYIKFYVYS